eukprot:22895-Eustigmatos_ZCMA.PRE.1
MIQNDIRYDSGRIFVRNNGIWSDNKVAMEDILTYLAMDANMFTPNSKGKLCPYTNDYNNAKK